MTTKINVFFYLYFLFLKFYGSFRLQTSSDVMVTQPGLSGALFVATVGSGKKAGAEDGKAAIIKLFLIK
ncbi:hypothetical protein [Chryseobacterium taihuense]|uniref:hypothetical protein n=1 Tax=Chryseobacterium taihuense TaxID=1141221 RepID=UPI000B7C93D0|nr:hypothetical protein [Chryseobacterium taihuense]